jgi:hypothetical protein
MNRCVAAAAFALLALGACGGKDAGRAGDSPGAAIQSASPLDKPFALKGGTAADVDALMSMFPEGARPTYESAAFDGSLGATVIKGLRFKDLDPDGKGSDSLLIERAELYGVDADAIARVKAAEAAEPDAPFEKMFEKVRLFGVKPQQAADAGTTIAAIEVDQYRVRRGAFKAADEDNPAAFFNSFEAAGIYFKDIVASANPESEAKVSSKIPDLRLVGLGGGKLGALIALDFEYEIEQSEATRTAIEGAFGPAGAMLMGPLRGFIAPDRQRTTVKSLEWRDIDAAGLMAYGLRKEKPPLSARNLINLGTMRLLGAETFIDGRRAASLAEASASALEFTWLAPSKIRTLTKGARYDFTAYLAREEEAAIAALKKHGLDSVDGGGVMSWDWDADRGGAQFKADFATDKLADLSMDAAFSGFELAKIEAALKAGDSNSALGVGKFNGFGLKFVDKKLLDAMFDVAALQMGGTGAELRASAPAMIRLSGASLSLGNPRMAAYVDAVANFVGEGGTLEISARPKTPVPFEAMAAAGAQGPNALPDLISLEVVHKKKAGK